MARISKKLSAVFASLLTAAFACSTAFADVYDQLKGMYDSPQAQRAQQSIMTFLAGPLIVAFRIMFGVGIVLLIIILYFAIVWTWQTISGKGGGEGSKGGGWNSASVKRFIGALVVAAMLTSGSWLGIMKVTQNLAVDPLTKIITEPVESRPN